MAPRPLSVQRWELSAGLGAVLAGSGEERPVWANIRYRVESSGSNGRVTSAVTPSRGAAASWAAAGVACGPATERLDVVRQGCSGAHSNIVRVFF